MPTKDYYHPDDWDKLHMNAAYDRAIRSKAKKRKVGAVIVIDQDIISDGYNGTPSGFSNDCEYSDYEQINYGGDNPVLKTKPEVLHAESNAITKLAKSNASCEGATLYITLSPCFECAKLIIQSGIVRVVYLKKYRVTTGICLLQKMGIEVKELTDFERV